MECLHLADAVKLTAEQLDVKFDACHVCKATDSLWLCLYCGVVHCGRYVNQHGVQHYETNQDHSVCLSCENFSIYCYICDEYVTNDNQESKLEQFITTLKKHNQKRTCVEEINSTCKRLKGGPRFIGLRNLGNTCFMNAVLQSLNMISEFSRFIRQLPPTLFSTKSPQSGQRRYNTRSSSGQQDGYLVEELRKLLMELKESDNLAVSPDSFFNCIWRVVPRFRGFQQQDAHEFMRYLLDRLHSELLELAAVENAKRTKQTIVTKMFGGMLQSVVHCLVCGGKSVKFDPILDLSIDIPDRFVSRNCKKDGPACNLNDCLKSFTETEELEETELYFCNHCKERKKSTKKFSIRRLPRVLCLHLKRFRWNLHCRTKLDTWVQFPLQGLCMNEYLVASEQNRQQDFIYDLAALIVHHGSGSGCGHYTAYGRHDGDWFHFNDSSVTLCSEQIVAKSRAYILVYVRSNH